ncbi:WD40-repeat-containing domain protein [Phlyctochytrium arcticum]|nr:WD40-repeat-containing domain protein [Phlyctochytrium arcticum]
MSIPEGHPWKGKEKIDGPNFSVASSEPAGEITVQSAKPPTWRRRPSKFKTPTAGGIGTPNAICFVKDLPDELLICVLANLEAKDMRTASKVCTRWHRVISDDSCWRCAFACYYGSLPSWRLSEDTWKRQYIRRSQMLRNFQRGKQNVQYDPRIGRIDDLFYDSQNRKLLCSSLERGMVAICHPKTGKVEKNYLYSHDNRSTAPVGAIAAESNRVAVGFLTGGISIIKDFATRPSPDIVRLAGFHMGPVSAICWHTLNPQIVLSGGNDGCVKVWNVASGICIRTLRGANGASITRLSNSDTGQVLAGNADGHVLEWVLESDMLMSESVNPTPDMPDLQPSHVYKFDGAASGTVIYIANDATGHVLLQVVGSQGSPNRCIRIWDTKKRALIGSFSAGHAAQVSVAALEDVDGTTDFLSTSTLLCTGDVLGIVCIWNIPKLLADGESILRSFDAKPLRTIDVHHSVVRSLHMDSFRVISGAEDGSAHIIDILTGKCIRTLLVRRTRGGNDGLQNIGSAGPANRHAIRCIWATAEHVTIASGEHMKSWAFFTPNSSGNSRKLKKKGGQSQNHNKQGGGRSHRGSQQELEWFEIRDEIRDSQLEQETRRDEEEWLRKKSIRINGVDISSRTGSQDGMTERELMDYAMVMSLQQTEAETQDRELLEALEQSLLTDDAVLEHSSQPTAAASKAISIRSTSPELDWSLDTPRSTLSSSWEIPDALPASHRSSRRGSRAAFYSSSGGSGSFSDTGRSPAWNTLAERYETNRNSSSKISLATQRINDQVHIQEPNGEDEEMQYILELSKIEK